MSKRTAIPVARSGNAGIDRAIEALAANVNAITGQEKNAKPLVKIAVPATPAEVLLNAIVDRLQGTT